MYGSEDKCIQSFGEKARGMRPVRGPRHRWEDNIKMDCRESEGGGYGLDSSGSE
jgi:hypothetical protein